MPKTNKTTKTTKTTKIKIDPNTAIGADATAKMVGVDATVADAATEAFQASEAFLANAARSALTLSRTADRQTNKARDSLIFAFTGWIAARAELKGSDFVLPTRDELSERAYTLAKYDSKESPSKTFSNTVPSAAKAALMHHLGEIQISVLGGGAASGWTEPTPIEQVAFLEYDANAKAGLIVPERDSKPTAKVNGEMVRNPNTLPVPLTREGIDRLWTFGGHGTTRAGSAGGEGSADTFTAACETVEKVASKSLSDDQTESLETLVSCLPVSVIVGALSADLERFAEIVTQVAGNIPAAALRSNPALTIRIAEAASELDGALDAAANPANVKKATAKATGKPELIKKSA